MAKGKRKDLKAEQPAYEPEIDQSYMKRHDELSEIKGKASDYEYESDKPDMSNKPSTYLPAPRVRRMSAQESAALMQPMQQPIQLPAQHTASVQLAPMEGTHTGHTRFTDDPKANAQASRDYAHIVGFWGFMGVTAVLVYAWLRGGLLNDTFVLSELGLLSVCMLIALLGNRLLGLRYSAPGIAKDELKSRDKAYDTYADVEKYRIDSEKYRIDMEKEVRLTELYIRRELGKDYLKRIEGDDE